MTTTNLAATGRKEWNLERLRTGEAVAHSNASGRTKVCRLLGRGRSFANHLVDNSVFERLLASQNTQTIER